MLLDIYIVIFSISIYRRAIFRGGKAGSGARALAVGSWDAATSHGACDLGPGAAKVQKQWDFHGDFMGFSGDLMMI